MIAPLEINNIAVAKAKLKVLFPSPNINPKINTKNINVLLKARNMGILITDKAFNPQNTPLT